jgi:hypothetical protein
MFFAAAQQIFEFLLGADVGLGIISLIQTHGPSLLHHPLDLLRWNPVSGA